jgi:hypothetical protein
MGFTRPDLPKADPDTFMQQPLMHRMKVLTQRWSSTGPARREWCTPGYTPAYS